MSSTDALMKRCQIGDGRWPHEANDLLAECYGRLGRQQQRIEELKAALRTIQREAYGIDQYLYDVASQAVDDE